MTWRQVAASGKDGAAMPAPRYLHTVAPCKASSAFLMFGGYVDGDAPFSNDVWRFDMAAAEEEEAQEGAQGGESGESGEGGEGGEGVEGGASLGVWRRLNASGAGPSPAFGRTSVADGAGHVFLFGGFGGTPNPTNPTRPSPNPNLNNLTLPLHRHPHPHPHPHLHPLTLALTVALTLALTLTLTRRTRLGARGARATVGRAGSSARAGGRRGRGHQLRL